METFWHFVAIVGTELAFSATFPRRQNATTWKRFEHVRKKRFHVGVVGNVSTSAPMRGRGNVLTGKRLGEGGDVETFCAYTKRFHVA